MRSIKLKRIFSAAIAVVMILLMLSLPALAETNHGGGGAGGETGKGSSDWKFTTNGRGIRISIYFVEGKRKESGNPDAEVYPIGDPTDFAKAGIPSNYTVKEYTRRSVFDYMNKKGLTYNPIYTTEEPYTYVHPTESVVKTMPEPFEGTRRSGKNGLRAAITRIYRISRGCAERKYLKRISVKAFIGIKDWNYMAHIRSSSSH